MAGSTCAARGTCRYRQASLVVAGRDRWPRDRPMRSRAPARHANAANWPSIDAVPYVEALGLADRRPSGRGRKPLPGGVDKGLSACNVRLRARRPTSLLYRTLCGEQLGTHRCKRTTFLSTSAGTANAANDSNQVFFTIHTEVRVHAHITGVCIT